MKAVMYSQRGWINQTDENYLKETFSKLLTEAGFHIEDQIHKTFNPYGYTGLWLLSESHFAIHTFPEDGKSYIEISSCIKEPFKKFKKAIRCHKVIKINKM